MYRADLDLTPGQITPQMVKELIESPVVIADLTGRNPNVYYELGIAHSFGRKTIVLCDSVDPLAFDTKDERAITLGNTYPLTAEKAETACTQLTQALRIVLDPAHKASSVVSKAATSRSLDELAPDDPIVSELAIIREGIDHLKSTVRPRQVIPRHINADIASMRQIIERLAEEGRIRPSNLRGSTNEHFRRI